LDEFRDGKARVPAPKIARDRCDRGFRRPWQVGETRDKQLNSWRQGEFASKRILLVGQLKDCVQTIVGSNATGKSDAVVMQVCTFV
jgi:hypothetical protein